MNLKDGEAVSTKVATETGHHVETVSRGDAPGYEPLLELAPVS